MKVLLAGATGAIGIPIARQLLAHGHQVLGLTRDPAAAGRLEALGVTPVVADALDRDRRVANAKATAELGWRPAYPTYHDGIRAMVAAERKEQPWPSPGRSGAGTRPA